MNKKPSPDLTQSAPLPKAAADAGTPAEHKGAAAQTEKRDVVLIHGMTDDKKGLKVLRARNDTVETGEVRPLADGQPITSDVVRLKPHKNAPYLCDVETEFSADELKGHSTTPRSGPAQVASRAYRENWDTIWSRQMRPTTDPQKLN